MVRTQVSVLFNDMLAMIDSGQIDTVRLLRRHCDEIKDVVSDTYHRLHDQLREGDPAATTVLYVYLNMLQETRENGILDPQIPPRIRQTPRPRILRRPSLPETHRGRGSLRAAPAMRFVMGCYCSIAGADCGDVAEVVVGHP